MSIQDEIRLLENEISAINEKLQQCASEDEQMGYKWNKSFLQEDLWSYRKALIDRNEVC